MLKERLIYGKKYAAIELAEDNCFYMLQLEKKKNTLVISKRGVTQTLEESISEIKGQKHLFLIFNNEKVLSKYIPNILEDKRECLRTAFPNITANDFYYEVLRVEQGSFVSIIRKNIINNSIETFKEKGISVIDFSLGNLAINSLKTILNEDAISTSNALIEITNNKIYSIKKEVIPENEYNINSLVVTNKEVLGLAGVISYYSKIISSSIQESLNSQYKNKRFFNLGLKGGLSFILMILIINFLLFNTYRSQLETINGELEIANTFKKQLTQIQEQVDLKKQLVESVDGASNTKITLFIDDVGFSTPKSVLLSTINYQPINGIQKEDKPLNYNKQLVIVKGVAKNNEAFSSWISDLEQKNWINAIEIKSYGKGKKNASNASFEFLIQTK